MNDEPNQNQRYEQFVGFFTAHEASLRAFVRSMVFTWDDVDEVMQNVALTLWKKFDTFDPETPFIKWSCVVARFEVLAFRRDKARDRHVFDEDLLEILEADAVQAPESLSPNRDFLDQCLTKLPEKMRKVLLAAYEPGARINEVAKVAGKSATAFYKILNRTRQSLFECIQRQQRKQEHFQKQQA